MVPLPADKIPIDCKTIYKIKYKSNGKLKRFKIQIVAKGYTQQEGVDYMDKFSLVVKMSIIRVLLALTVANNWYLHQLGMNNNFLHGELEEDIYMNPLEGYPTLEG